MTLQVLGDPQVNTQVYTILTSAALGRFYSPYRLHYK